MNLHSYIKMTGKLSIKKFNANNELIMEQDVPNLIVTVGKEHVAERLINSSEPKMDYMAIGAGITVPAVANSTLVSELARQPMLSATRSGSNITYTATFGIGVGTGSVTEAGIFNATSAGSMLCRTTFPVITKAASESIAISWTVTVG